MTAEIPKPDTQQDQQVLVVPQQQAMELLAQQQVQPPEAPQAERVIRKSWASVVLMVIGATVVLIVFLVIYFIVGQLLTQMGGGGMFVSVVSLIFGAVIPIVIVFYLIYILVAVRRLIQERVVIKPEAYGQKGHFVIKTVGLGSRTAVYPAEGFVRVEQRRSLLGRLFGYGTGVFVVEPEQEQGTGNVVVSDLHQFDSYLEEIQRVIDSARGGGGAPTL